MAIPWRSLGVVILVSWYTASLFEEAQFDPDELVKGKNVLVTGASSGIGEATALEFCRLGANVMVTARRKDRLAKVVEECSSVGLTGAKHGYVTADMADLDSAGQVVEEAVKKLGSLDYLILNHAYTGMDQLGPYPYTASSEQLMKKIFDINFFSYVRMLSVAMPYLRQTSGRVSVTSSVAGRFADMFASIYIGTKHSMEEFFRCLNLENHFMETNVSITVATLGAVDVERDPSVQTTYMEMADNLGLDMAKTMENGVYNAPASREGCAKQIIRSAALREVETYYPKDHTVWWPIIKSLLDPNFMKKLVLTYKKKPASTS